MFIFVIAANIIAALLGCCGLIQIYHVIANSQQSQGAQHFFSQLSDASLPLLGAAILYGLAQACQLLENIAFQQQLVADETITPVNHVKPARQSKTSPAKASPAKQKKKEEGATPFFGEAVVEPDPEPEEPMQRVLPPIPELEIISEKDLRPAKEKDDGLSYFRVD